MNSLSPSQPLLVVIIGLPGAGKSFFGRRFAETFNAPLISFDEIRTELFNEISHSSDEDVIVSRMAGLQLRELLKTKKTIVIDGGHNPKISRMELNKLAHARKYDTLYVWVQADERITHSRSLHRSAKKDDDVYNRSLTADEFTSQVKKFTAPGNRESFVVISGHHTFATQAKTVLKKLTASHNTPRSIPKHPSSASKGRRVVSF